MEKYIALEGFRGMNGFIIHQGDILIEESCGSLCREGKFVCHITSDNGKKCRLLIETIKTIETTKDTVTLDYEKEYHELRKEHETVLKENEKLTRALINIALKL